MHRRDLSGKALLSLATSLALVFLGLSVAAPAQAQTKVGVVDMERVLNESVAGKRSLESLKKLREQMRLEGEKKQQELITRERALQEQQRDFQARRGILREEERRRKAEELRRAAREVSRLREDLRRLVEDQRAELVDRRQRLMENILKEVREVVTKVGREKGLTIILDKRTVLYHDAPKVDLTDRIIRIYDQQKQ